MQTTNSVSFKVLTQGDSDLSQSATCVRKIYRAHGFEGWMGWKAHCRGSAVEPYKNRVRKCLGGLESEYDEKLHVSSAMQMKQSPLIEVFFSFQKNFKK